VKRNVSVGEVRAHMVSQLKYVLAELESMLATRVSETVNRFASLDELRATNDILKRRVLSKQNNLNINNL
jgi:hypothetical protein